ncbi:MAG: ribosomal RNA small subunit methyltransferase A [Desulfurobacterium sp.]|nr:MAG: ribosomal RNA small subunit methyltransferase A [Desulfurobacterium sp.]
MSRLKKSLGQHFLRDKKVVKRIVDSGKFSHKDSVLEIGAGGGALTEEIVSRNPKEFIAVEIDPEWVSFLKEKFGDRVKVINADATEFDFSSLGKKFVYFGNLPYNVSTAILRNLLTHRKTLKKGIFMVQKEVADRLTAKSGKEYGYFPALLSLFFEIKKLFNVPPKAFTPPPKVMSTVIEITPKEFDMEEEELKEFENFLKRAFSQRRKKLKKNLGLKELPEELKEFKDKRAEEILAGELLKIFRLLKKL